MLRGEYYRKFLTFKSYHICLETVVISVRRKAITGQDLLSVLSTERKVMLQKHPNLTIVQINVLLFFYPFCLGQLISSLCSFGCLLTDLRVACPT